MPVSYFFEGRGGKAEPAADILGARTGLERVRNYDACPEDVRKCVYLLAKSVADFFAPAANKETN